MNTFVMSLLLTIQFAAVASPYPGKKDRPTKLAHYQIGVYMAAQGTKLRVNVDKKPEGSVYVQLLDQADNLYFDQTIRPFETQARISLDISELYDGEYVLKVSNGLDVELRHIRISTTRPTTPKRSITLLQEKADSSLSKSVTL